MIFIALYLLLFGAGQSIVNGSEVVEQAPDLEGSYMMIFPKEKELLNPVNYGVDMEQESESRFYRTFCRVFQDKKTHVLDIVMDDDIHIDTVFVSSCDALDVIPSFTPLDPDNNMENFYFVGADGKCHQRSYVAKVGTIASLVERSKVKTSDCPKAVEEEMHGKKGIVEGFSPEGKAVQNDYTHNRAEEEPSYQTVTFPDAQGYKLVCREDKLKDVHPSTGKQSILTGTVEFGDVPLDRFVVKSCDVVDMKPETAKTENGVQKHYITYKDAKGCHKREYDVSTESKEMYKKVTITRKTPADIPCQH